MKFRKKPVVIEAFQYGIDNQPAWFRDKVSSDDIICYCKYGLLIPKNCFCEIKTLEGTMTANYSDYIIQGVNGEIYPCKADIFDKTYEPVEE